MTLADIIPAPSPMRRTIAVLSLSVCAAAASAMDHSREELRLYRLSTHSALPMERRENISEPLALEQGPAVETTRAEPERVDASIAATDVSGEFLASTASLSVTKLAAGPAFFRRAGRGIG